MTCKKFCAKIDRALLILVTLLMVFSTGFIVGLYLIYKQIKEGLWLDPDDQSLVYETCIVCYFIFYLLALALVITRMVFRK